MSNPIRTLSLITAVVLTALLPVGTLAQSLADVARKEEARRKAVKGEAKVYTNDDLVKAREGTAPPSETPAATTVPGDPKAAADKSPTDKPTATDAGKGEEYWKKRMKAAQDSLNRNKVLQVALEGRVNGLNAEFVNMDNPFQRTVIQENLKTAMAELERVKRDIVTDTKAITDIQEEARKTNVPPGWLR